LKIEHSSGSHDDSLFAYLVGRYVLSYGKNLNKFLLPINGKDSESRHKSMSKMNLELSKLNNPFINQYNGAGSDIVSMQINERNRELSNDRSKYSIFNKIANIDNQSPYNQSINFKELDEFTSLMSKINKYKK